MENQAETDRGPNPIDRHVGLRIRMRRKELGVSQEKLADCIGLTFQQVQKYERAANRVSASKLWEMARALHTSVNYFYEGLGGVGTEAPPSNLPKDAVQDFLLTSEGLELAAAFPRIGAPRLRRKLLELVRILGDEAPGEA
jgi:transcriptional regulator with XRE-family HTH domain